MHRNKYLSCREEKILHDKYERMLYLKQNVSLGHTKTVLGGSGKGAIKDDHLRLWPNFKLTVFHLTLGSFMNK